jgi:hypothetical protein
MVQSSPHLSRHLRRMIELHRMPHRTSWHDMTCRKARGYKYSPTTRLSSSLITLALAHLHSTTLLSTQNHRQDFNDYTMRFFSLLLALPLLGGTLAAPAPHHPAPAPVPTSTTHKPAPIPTPSKGHATAPAPIKGGGLLGGLNLGANVDIKADIKLDVVVTTYLKDLKGKLVSHPSDFLLVFVSLRQDRRLIDRTTHASNLEISSLGPILLSSKTCWSRLVRSSIVQLAIWVE